ncbi:MAG: proton-conducting transporter membrane subunit [Bacillota bacterium]|nr:proton-conducting transporter membrane subunit [Bacillota bacterium]HHU61056.1 monovalent cation/H+ antiporter subunit D family protein [Natronincola sp.]
MAAAVKDNLPVLLIVTLLSSAYLLPILTRVRKFRLVEFFAVFVLALTFTGGVVLAYKVLATGAFNYIVGGWPAPWGIELTINALSGIFLLTIGLVTIPILLYASADLVEEVGSRQRAIWFLTLFLLLTAAASGLAVTGDMFNIFVFVEVATIASCAIVSARNDAASVEATFKYLMLATIGSGFVLLGIGFLYMLTGNLNLNFINMELSTTWHNYPTALWMAMSFFTVGFGVKSALFPLHVWLPDAHSTAITPASAVLSSLAVKGYIVALLKVFYLAVGAKIIFALPITNILLLLGMIAIIAGALFALSQDELKRRLAFSTVSQIGYIFLGIGLGTIQGLAGGLLHILSHGITKALLFLAAGTIVKRTGKTRISHLSGLGFEMPITFGVFAVGTLSMIGIPLFSGFVSKWQLLLGSLEKGNYLAVLVLIGGSLLAAAYLLPVLRVAFFQKSEEEQIREPEAPYVQKVAMLFLAVVIIFVGMFPGIFLELARQAAESLLGMEVLL